MKPPSEAHLQSPPIPNGTARTRRRRILLATGLIVAVGLGLFVRWMNRPFPTQTLALPDGGKIILDSVQGGIFHFSPHDTPVQKFLARLSPAQLKRIQAWGWRFFSLDVEKGDSFNALEETEITGVPARGSLSVWLTYPTRSVWANQRVTLEDDTGYQTDPVSRMQQGLIVGGTSWESYLFAVVPRRSPWLTVAVQDFGIESPLLGRLRVRNPLYQPDAPAWPALPPPVSVPEADAEFVLSQLTVATNLLGVRMDQDRLASARFSVRERGQPSAAWTAVAVRTARDPTGNAVEGWVNASPDRPWNQGSSCHFPALPWSDAWRLETEFIRIRDMPASQRWSPRSVPIAAHDRDFPSTRTRLEGLKVEVVSLVLDTGRQPPEPDPAPNDVHVVLRLFTERAPATQSRYLVVVRAVDDQGRDVTPDDNIITDNYRDLPLALSPGAKAIDLDLAYVPVRVVTFTAQPTLIDAKSDPRKAPPGDGSNSVDPP